MNRLTFERANMLMLDCEILEVVNVIMRDFDSIRMCKCLNL